MKRYPEGGMAFGRRTRRLFVLAGTFRPPTKGEWYLSGAVKEAYQARNDLSSSFHILLEVPERRGPDRRRS